MLVFLKQVDNNPMKPNIIRSFFILFQQSIKHNQAIFTMEATLDIGWILGLLYRDGLILYYTQSSPESINKKENEMLYTVCLGNDAVGLPPLRKIGVFENDQIYANFRLLKALKERPDFVWGLVRTARGLFTISDCVKRGIGGQLIVYIVI